MYTNQHMSTVISDENMTVLASKNCSVKHCCIMTIIGAEFGHGLGPSMGWVGLGRDFEIFDGLGWVKDDWSPHPIRVY